MGFSRTSTAEDVAAAFDARCKGIAAVVTGANVGLGLETARVLAEHGARVVFACRSLHSGQEAVAKTKAASPGANVEAMELDLGSLRSVKAFAAAYEESKWPLHLLINNAGVMSCPRTLTSDGLEMQFGVNHLGHFYLTKLMLPRLAATGTAERPARVINLSSMGNWLFGPAEGIKFEDINGEKEYNTWERYGQSKLANILFTKELNKRMLAEGQHVISLSVHPGAILSTNLNRHWDFWIVASMLRNIWSRGWVAVKAVGNTFNKTTEQGASTTLVAALCPDVVPGEHYSDCSIETVQVHPMARDVGLASRLWEFSEELIACKVA